MNEETAEKVQGGLLLVGTGHVFRIREAVTDLVSLFAPRAVAVELDPLRLRGLLERERAQAEGRPPPEAQNVGRVYRWLARFQERMAASQGSQVGEEMMAAVEAARRLGLPLLTIDVDARGLFGKAWREMGWRERLRLVRVMVKGLFSRSSGMEEELDEYNRDPGAYLERIGQELPTVKRVLIDERDEHMARALEQAVQRFGAVAAVVGDGHVNGLRRHLEGRGVEPDLVVRLPDLRVAERWQKVRQETARLAEGRGLHASISEDGSKASFSF